MTLNQVLRIVMGCFLAASAAMALGCSDKKVGTTTVPAPTPSAPATTPASAPAPSPSSSAPVIPPGTGEDVTKKGTSTGMIGGEAGTVASSGKPGTGTESGAGTGAAQGSGGQTTDKK